MRHSPRLRSRKFDLQKIRRKNRKKRVKTISVFRIFDAVKCIAVVSNSRNFKFQTEQSPLRKLRDEQRDQCGTDVPKFIG
tara:strand:+ start:6248 stop:6487 length:240 start_codon:yes stop_codon:yes gene_type:complete